jgi:signal transduction histidine kinase
MHIEFTSDYQDVGLHEPLWQNPFEAFKNASSAFQNEGITFISNDIPIWIFSDPLLERVFYNCIDNSLRHGEKVTTITLDGY